MKNLLPKAHSSNCKWNLFTYFAVILAWAALFLIVGLLCGRFSVSAPAISLLPLVGSGMVLHYLFLWHERRHAMVLHKEVYHKPKY